MKKAVSLILALALCLSLCACGGGGNSTDTPTTTDEATETNISNPLLDVMNDRTWYFLQFNDSEMLTSSDGTCVKDSFFWKGTWQLDNDTITMVMGDSTTLGYPPKTMQFKLIEHNGVYFLIGEDGTLSSVPLDNLTTKTVDMTLENWENYFEITTYSHEVKDMFGEVQETEKRALIKIKDEYLNKLVVPKSQVLFRLSHEKYDTTQDSEAEGTLNFSTGANLGYQVDGWYNIDEFGNCSVTKIQGQLVFVDGI